MQPFHTITPAGQETGELHLFILVDAGKQIHIFRYAKGSELVPQGFGAIISEGSGEGILHAGFLEGAHHFGVLIDGGGHRQAQLIQQRLVDVPGTVVVHVLRHQVANVIALAVGGRDGIAGIVQVQAADIVGHDVLGKVFIQGQQQSLGHAVFFHVHAVTQNHVRILAGGKHQVQLGGPVGILHRLEIHMNAGLGFQFLEKPQVVEIHVLILQGILESGQVDLFLRHGGTAKGQHHHHGQQQGNKFFHGEISFLSFDSRT